MTTPSKPYHHGALGPALLAAAEKILERDGIQGLTLRAAAREAGASHAAPKNHFGDLTGLLSELAAVGYGRFREAMLDEVRPGDTTGERAAAAGRGYVRFALANPGLFMLMFRSERLDVERPALKQAMREAFLVLAGAREIDPATIGEAGLTLEQGVSLMHAWSMVHGFAMLALDGRLASLLVRMPPGTQALDLLDAMVAPDRAVRPAGG